MRNINKLTALLLAVLMSLSVLAGCGAEKAEEPVRPTPVPSAVLAAAPKPTPIATPEPSLEPTPEPSPEVQPEEPKELTAADRAAAKGLPIPPDVDISSWEFKVANSYNNLMYYVPPYANFEGQGIDQRIEEITTELMAAAREAGYRMYLPAIFRNYDFQFTYYYKEVTRLDDAYEASKIILGPGNSDHQTGLSFDISASPTGANYSIFDNSAVLDTELYQWMLENCADYGFILRYPEGKEEYYGTACTPGHFRYVGVEAAKYIMENNLCLEEFILLYDEDAVYVPGIS